MTRVFLRIVSLALLAVPAAAVALTASPAHAQQEVGSRGTLSVQQCMQQLAAYGRWYSHPDFGWVWQPHDVQPWWQPFSVGEWVVTQDGSPYWRSALPFGWAVEHYGAWTFDDSKGWLWVPGNEWSAAPVSWRGRDGVIGWAPQVASAAGTRGGRCDQPAQAWIFVASDRLMTSSNFVVAEQDLLSRDAHGTWGEWAHSDDGLQGARMPEPRNANLLGVTECLADADAKAAFGAAVRARGGSLQGPPISFVNSRSAMGSGRVSGGQLPVYAPVFTGTAPAAGGDFMVNPPAPRVQRAQPAAPIARAAPVQRAQPAAPAQRANPAQPVQPALPTPAATPSAPLTPYEAYTFQHEQLDRYHADQWTRLQQQHAQDDATAPYPGFDASQLPAWKQRELLEMQRMAARQRALLDKRQQQHAEENGG